MQVQAKLLPNGEGLPLPFRQTEGAAGMDLYAALPDDVVVSIDPGTSRLVPCGFALALPMGFEMQVRPRSGLALKHQITVLNSPGTVDSDYRGEIAAILINHGTLPFRIKRGDRIAQAVICRHEVVELVETGVLPLSARGEGGYGSTGVAVHP